MAGRRMKASQVLLQETVDLRLPAVLSNELIDFRTQMILSHQ